MSATSPAESLSRFVRLVARRLWLGNLFHGLGRAVSLIALLFWISLIVDYGADRWFEAGIFARAMLSMAWGALIFLIIGRWVIGKAIARPDDRSIAVWIERHHPTLSDQLITAIELRDPPEGMSHALVDESARRAWEFVRSLNVRRLIPFRAVRSSWIVATTLLASIVALAIVAPAVASVWGRRVMTMARVEYPRWTRFSLVSAREELTKIPKGKDFTIAVDVDTSGVVPDRAVISIQSTANGNTIQEPMTRQGGHRFRFDVQHPIEAMRFRIHAGDARSAWHRLELVESPLVTSAIITVRPPAYTGITEQMIPISGSAISLPVGSDIVISLSFSKAIDSLTVYDGKSNIASKTVSDTAYEIRIKLDASRMFRIQAKDRDGLSLVDDFLVELTATPDKPPEVVASFRGVSPGLTRKARIPLQVKAEDDYGIERMEYVISVASSPPSRKPMSGFSGEVTSINENETFDVSSIRLEPASKWTLEIVATDHSGQSDSSEKLTFEIITPEELMTRMAAQEVMLRERFEQVVTELREAQRALSEMGGDSTSDAPARRLSCDRAMAIVRKGSSETKSIAEGFANIIDEFTNNQMASSDILERLGNGIRLPMTRLCDEAFPKTITDLERLAVVSETKDYLPPRDASLLSLNEALFQCEQILRGMTKLESFNELVSNLKGIIDEEQKLRDNIQKARKEKALDLLKD